MLWFEPDTEENGPENKAGGEEAFDLLYPVEVVTADIEGYRGQVQRNVGLDPVQGPVQEGREREWRLSLCGRVYFGAWEGRHFDLRVGKLRWVEERRWWGLWGVSEKKGGVTSCQADRVMKKLGSRSDSRADSAK